MKSIRITTGGGLAAICALFAFSSATYAQPVSPGGAFFVAGSPVYNSTSQIWEVLQATLNSGSVKKAGGVGNQYMFKAGDPNTFTWNGEPLGTDLSSGGLAQATFSDGGVLQVDGTIRSATFPNPVIFTGNILTATVSGFELRETDVNSNTINSINQTIKFTVTGGYLNTNATLRLDGTYEFAMVGAVTGPTAGGPLNDFSADLKSLQAFQINYILVPEPTSLLLLGSGIVMMGVRRRRSGRA